MSDFGSCFAIAKLHPVPIITRPRDKDHIHLEELPRCFVDQLSLGSSPRCLVHVVCKAPFHHTSKDQVPFIVVVSLSPAAYDVLAVELHVPC